jgi:hypothetical protein
VLTNQQGYKGASQSAATQLPVVNTCSSVALLKFACECNPTYLMYCAVVHSGSNGCLHCCNCRWS